MPSGAAAPGGDGTGGVGGHGGGIGGHGPDGGNLAKAAPGGVDALRTAPGGFEPQRFGGGHVGAGLDGVANGLGSGGGLGHGNSHPGAGFDSVANGVSHNVSSSADGFGNGGPAPKAASSASPPPAPSAGGSVGGSYGGADDALAKGLGGPHHPAAGDFGSSVDAFPKAVDGVSDSFPHAHGTISHGNAGTGPGGAVGGSFGADGTGPKAALGQAPGSTGGHGGEAGLHDSLDDLARSLSPTDGLTTAEPQPPGPEAPPASTGGLGPSWLGAGALGRAPSTHPRTWPVLSSICPACHKRLPRRSRFCGFCGECLDRTMA